MIKLSYKTDGKTYLNILAEIDIAKLGRNTLPSTIDVTDKWGEVWQCNFCPYQENIIFIHSKILNLGHLNKDRIEIHLDSGHNMFRMYWALVSVAEYLNKLVEGK